MVWGIAFEKSRWLCRWQDDFVPGDVPAPAREWDDQEEEEEDEEAIARRRAAIRQRLQQRRAGEEGSVGTCGDRGVGVLRNWEGGIDRCGRDVVVVLWCGRGGRGG
jgi:hypothetical protein